MVEFVKLYIDFFSCFLVGNSIYCDKMFLEKYMLKFMEQFYYRIIDVSLIKELCR